MPESTTPASPEPDGSAGLHASPSSGTPSNPPGNGPSGPDAPDSPATPTEPQTPPTPSGGGSSRGGCMSMIIALVVFIAAILGIATQL
ncbi:hypothetical protein ACQP2P_06795 [Dactylosporangium sp. CA-139114]|uniref:hypothetical protein n=1 Tax=Dactylosporangium sp. CA-139114 TaxID=3239931 RepID=UPI003D96D93F